MEEQDKQVIVGKSKEVNETVATERRITDLLNVTPHPDGKALFIYYTDYFLFNK